MILFSVRFKALQEELAMVKAENERLKAQAAAMKHWLAGNPSEPPVTGSQKSALDTKGYTDE